MQLSKIFRSILLALLLSGLAYQSLAQTNTVPDDVELAVLKKLYDSLGGAGWISKTNWPTPGNWPASATSAEFGTWQGIGVKNGDISTVALNDNNLVGKLPRDIGKLKKLISLYLPSNKITGKIPGAFGKLTNLTSLYLADNELQGSLPDSLGYMASLQTFYVHQNNLSGSIPSTFGLLHELTNFYVHSNMLSGALPGDLGNCDKIKYFNVGDNEFTGTIPLGCGSWSGLVSWSCYNNHFTGTLPAGIFSNRASLTYVNVNDNEFEGEFPSISGSPALASLAARYNSFTALPAGVLINTVVTVLDFRDNELRTLPDLSTQANKTNLSLSFSNNRLDPASMEAAKGAGLKSVVLTPQKNFKDVTRIDPAEGQPLVIPGRAPGSGSIAWEKLGSNGTTWSNVDAQNQDPSKLTFKRNAYAKAIDEGIYRLSITNGQFPGTVFRSEPIRVQEQLTIVLDDWAFQYRYDGRNRVTHRKVPGTGWVYMVYDQRDRLVMMQDAEQRTSNKWLVTKYDALNRPVITGIYTHGSTVSQEDMSGLISTTNFYETFSTTGNAAFHGYSNDVFPKSGLQILTVTYYDNYDFLTGWGKEYEYAANQVASRTVNGRTYDQEPEKFPNVVGQVTGSKVRTLEMEPNWLQTVMYYNDNYRPVQVVSDNYKKGIDRGTNIYDFVGKILAAKTDHVVNTITWANVTNLTVTTDKLTKSATGSAWNTSGASSTQQIPVTENGWVEATVAEVNTQRIFGLSEGYTTRDLASVKYGFLQNGATLSVRANGTEYPVTGSAVAGDRLRVAREYGVISFYKNGIRIPTGAATYPNTAALIAEVSIYTSGGTISRIRMSAAQGQRQIVDRHMAYDHAGRLKETWHKLNTTGSDILLAKNEYNELGQLVDKKLHSTMSSGADAKQSVDYRYNIRGWLTSINNAALANNATNNDSNDLFGMNLAYNTSLGLGVTPQFNGNISEASYSKDLGKGDVKQTGYGFKYDPMNRLTDAVHQQRTTQNGAWAGGGFDEGEIGYDLNGNIQKLKRKDAGGVVIDDLEYKYENSDITISNKLLSVEDKIANAKGFSDGNSGSKQDYTYDANGNMTRDLNKGIGNSTSDAANVTTYNHLNLPQTVSKGGSTIRYVYDATGRKLAQYVTSGASQKRTDYAGEFIYEDNVLQFMNHEEGRIVVASTKPVYTNSFDEVDPDNMTAVNVGLGEYEGKGEKYVLVTTSNTTPGNGVFPIGEAINVDVNERYRVRVKAYAGASPAYLQVQIKSGANVTTSTALIPNSSANEAWIELVVQTPTSPSGASLTLEAGVVWNTVTASERMYLNELEVIKLETTTPEYQYHLKDHLGNVRLTFTTKEDVETNKATMEEANWDAEDKQFHRYEEVRKVRSALFDHTNNTNTTSPNGLSIRLSGNDKEKTGLVKTLSVMPGDVVHMKVYAKYVGSNSADWSTALNNLITAIAGANSGTVVDGNNYLTGGATPFPYTGLNGTNSSSGLGPKAYLNYIMFDRNYTPIIEDPSQTNFVRVEQTAKEDGKSSMANGIPHQLLEATVNVKQAGYLYIYLSNEESSPVEVFFDDFEVEHTKGPVVQSDEYYPYGATFNSYTRENGLPQKYLYQTKDWNTALGLNQYDIEWRQYDPFGVFTTTNDPHADSYVSLSPRSWVAGNPMSIVDLTGMDIVETNIMTTYTGVDVKGILRQLQSSMASKGAGGGNGGGEKTGTSSKPSYHVLMAQQRERERQQADPTDDPLDLSGIPNHEPYGFWEYFFFGGLEDNGVWYNRDGTPFMKGVKAGTPPDWFGPAGGIKTAGKGVKLLVQQRGVWKHAINGRAASKETLKAYGLLKPNVIPTVGKATVPQFIEKAEGELAKTQNPGFWSSVRDLLLHAAQFFGN